MKNENTYGNELLTINKNEVIKTNIPGQLVPAFISALLILILLNVAFVSLCLYIINSNDQLAINTLNSRSEILLETRIIGINIATIIELGMFIIVFIPSIFIKSAKYKIKEKSKQYILYDAGIYEKGKHLSKIADYNEIKDIEKIDDTIVITSIYNDKRKLRDVEKIEYNFITLRNIVNEKKNI